MILSGKSPLRRFYRASAHALFLVPVSFVSGSGAQVPQWQTVRHSKVLFYLPKSWEVKIETANGDFEGISPKSNESDPFQERIEVDIVERAKDLTLTEFATKEVVALAGRLSNFEIIDSGPVTHGSHQGLEIEGSYNSSWGEIRVEIFYLEAGDQFYEITLKGQTTDLESIDPLFDEILAAMKPLSDVFDQVYTNPKFIIQFPADWDVKEGLPGTVVAGVSPRSSGSDGFRERVTVAYEPLQGGMTAGKYADKMFDILLDRLPGAKEIARREAAIGGIDGFEIELSHTLERDRTTLRVLIVPDDRMVFVFNCSGRDPDYTKFQATFNQILNSFASTSPPSRLRKIP